MRIELLILTERFEDFAARQKCYSRRLRCLYLRHRFRAPGRKEKLSRKLDVGGSPSLLHSPRLSCAASCFDVVSRDAVRSRLIADNLDGLVWALAGGRIVRVSASISSMKCPDLNHDRVFNWPVSRIGTSESLSAHLHGLGTSTGAAVSFRDSRFHQDGQVWRRRCFEAHLK